MNASNTRKLISNSWIFRISGLAFIISATPTLANFTHGSIGFVLIVVAAIFISLFENSFRNVFVKIFNGLSRNKLLVFLVFWYVSGVTVNSLLGGNGIYDWRYFLTNVIFIFGIFYAFAFIRYRDCLRKFQIGFILISGIQAIFAIQALLTTPGIARLMFKELNGTWIFGNPSSFAVYTILLPIFFWRSFQEKGWLKLLLLISSLLVLISAALSSFGTPIGLMIIGGVFILFSSIFFMLRKKGLEIVIIFIIAGFIGYQSTQNNSYFDSAYSRIQNFFLDPTLVGYSSQNISASRWYIDQLSINSFMSEPFFGMGGGNIRYSDAVGGHSSFFDALGAYGLLGGGGALVGIILLMGVITFRRFLFKRDWETLLALTSVIMLIVAGIVNPYWEANQPMLVLIMARSFYPA